MSALEKLEQRWLREGARDEAEYAAFLVRRAAGEPVHRILGWREFWGLKFFLSPETLEPRPDSETVIEVLKKLLPLEEEGKSNVKLLDLGAGTGCLLLAALHEFPHASGIGIDISAGAVAAGRKNAAHLNLSGRVEFHVMDWDNLDDIEKLKSAGPFDIVLCNPPYIPQGEIQHLQTEVRNYDPITALNGGADGLASYRLIALQLHGLLKPHGIAVFEIGHNQAVEVQAVMAMQNLVASAPHKDLGGNDRVIAVTRA